MIPTMKKPQRMKEILPVTNSIFSHMDYNFRATWSKTTLDVMFFSNCGERNPSPIVEIIQGEYGKQLDDAQLTQLAQMVLEMFKDKWDKLGRVYDIEYDPIHNFLDDWEDTSEGATNKQTEGQGAKIQSYGKVVEDDSTLTNNLATSISDQFSGSATRTNNLQSTETRDTQDSSTRTDNLTETLNHGRTETRTDNLTETSGKTVTTNGQNANQNSFYGYNSSGGNDDTASSGTSSSTENTDFSQRNTGTQQNVLSGSDSITNTGTQTDVVNKTGTNTVRDTGTVSDSVQNSDSKSIQNTGTKRTAGDVETSGADGVNNFSNEKEQEENIRVRSGKHTGNIGNLTSQKQIAEEISLWAWNYMNTILDDVKEVLTLPVYLTQYRLVDQAEE